MSKSNYNLNYVWKDDLDLERKIFEASAKPIQKEETWKKGDLFRIKECFEVYEVIDFVPETGNVLYDSKKNGNTYVTKIKPSEITKIYKGEK